MSVKPVSALRNALVRKSLRVFSIGAVAITVLGLVLVAAPPAGAVTYGPFYLRETYSSYRLDAPSLNLYDPVKETLGNGREIYLGGTGTADHYKISFMRDTTKCVAAANNGSDVEVKSCSGDGTVWIAFQGADGCSGNFESQEFSGMYLSGHDNGSQYQIRRYQAAGWYQQFKFVDPQTGNVECI